MRYQRWISLWITWGVLWTACGSLSLLAACDGDPSPRSADPARSGEPVENARRHDHPLGQDDRDERAEDDPALQLEPLPGDLPEPSEGEQLEADCFAGDPQACDQLGH